MIDITHTLYKVQFKLTSDVGTPIWLVIWQKVNDEGIGVAWKTAGQRSNWMAMRADELVLAATSLCVVSLNQS